MDHPKMRKVAMLHFFILVMTFTCISSQMIFPENNDHSESGPQASFVGTADDYGNTVSAGNVYRVDNTKAENRISHGLNNFALNLNKAILREQIFTNIVLSPLSIAGALTLLLLGSVGKTYNEIAYALGFFNEITDSQSVHREFGSFIDKITKKDGYASSYYSELPNVTYGSALFLQSDTPIRQQYEDFVKSIYKSTIIHTDFRSNAVNAQATINRWVNDLTNGRIQEILSSPPPQHTRLVITTAMYFRGLWEKFFLDGLTKRLPFVLDKRNPQQTITVDMMANEGFFPFHRSKELECMIVGLPYKGNNTMLYAIKPLDATRKDIQQIVNDLTADSLDNLIRSARRQSTIVTFPKMRLSSSYNLKTVLQNMGIQSIFSSTESNLALLSPLQVNAVVPMPERFMETEDQFIFSRLGEVPSKNDCAQIFQNKNSSGATCTTVELINNQNVTVVYKQIGDKVGRRIIKRSIKSSQLKNNGLRLRRQMSVDTWNPGLYVDEVLHKVDIDITETGTEAASVTAVFISRDGRRPVFTANEPFFFFIQDEDSKFILFSAIVHKPIPHYT